MSRPGRTGGSVSDIFDMLTSRERLLISQVVFELGANDWKGISDLLVKHPLIEESNRKALTPSVCHGLFLVLMKDAGQALPDGIPDEAKRPRAKCNVPPATKWYQTYLRQVKEDIIKLEDQFKATAAEIQEIQTGAWDDRLKREAALENQKKRPKPGHQPPTSISTRRSTRTGTRISEPPGHGSGTATDGSPAASEGLGHTSSVRDPISSPVADIAPHSPTVSVALPTASTGITTTFSSLPGPSNASDVRPSNESGSSITADTREVTAETPSEAMDDDVEDEKPKARRVTRRQTISRGSKPAAVERAPSESSRGKRRSRGASEMTVEEPNELPTSTRAKVRGIIPQTPAVQPNPVAAKKFQTVISLLQNNISTHKHATIFHQPITEKDAPGYSRSVKRPIDLKTIRQKIKEGSIKDSLEFQRDIYLMYANAFMYNPPGSSIAQMAEEMMQATEKYISDHKQTEEFRSSS